MPPYLVFQAYSVASETPCLRARPAVLGPRLMLPQHPNNLLFRSLARFICPSFTRPAPTPLGGLCRGRSVRQTKWKVRSFQRKRPCRGTGAPRLPDALCLLKDHYARSLPSNFENWRQQSGMHLPTDRGLLPNRSGSHSPRGHDSSQPQRHSPKRPRTLY